MPTDACQFFYDCKGCGERLIMPRGRLLRVLLLRVGAVPADTEQLALLCKREAPRRYRAQEHSERDVLPVEHNSSGSTPRRAPGRRHLIVTKLLSSGNISPSPDLGSQEGY
jgi:hypothetical protein